MYSGRGALVWLFTCEIRVRACSIYLTEIEIEVEVEEEGGRKGGYFLSSPAGYSECLQYISNRGRDRGRGREGRRVGLFLIITCEIQ